MDSKYFRGKKAIQSLRHFTKIRLWYSVTAPWMSVLAQAQPKEYRVPLEAAGTMEFFLLRTERDENCATNSFQTRGCWSGVSVSCASSSQRSQTAGVYRDAFTRLPHQIILRVPILLHTLLPQAGNSCVTAGTPICLLAARDTQALQTHRASAPSAAAAALRECCTQIRRSLQ